MKSKLFKTCTAAAIIGLASVNTQAALIWLQPTTQTIGLGDVATLEMYADASDVGGFLAGGLDLFYDHTIIAYNDDFAFDAAFPTDPAFSRPGDGGDPDNCTTDPSVAGCSGPGEINGIAFGSFFGLAADGPTLVGTLSFTGLHVGHPLFSMADNDVPAGNWFATDGTDLAGRVEYYVTPLPAAAWLMFGGLVMLLGFVKKRST